MFTLESLKDALTGCSVIYGGCLIEVAMITLGAACAVLYTSVSIITHMIRAPHAVDSHEILWLVGGLATLFPCFVAGQWLLRLL